MANAFGATMAVMIFLTLLVGGGVYYFVHLKKRQTSLEEQNSKLEKLRAVIISKISDIAEISTVREDFNAEIIYKDATEWNGIKLPLTGIEFRMTYSGVIVCGCDLTKIAVPQNSVTENSATIIIPRSKVIHIYPIVESYNIIDLKTGFFAKKISLEQQNMLVASDLESEKQRLINEGILKRADENIEYILQAQMQSIGVTPRILFNNYNSNSQRLLN